MTRTILAGLAAAVSGVALLGTGCQSTGIGDPCTPEQEYLPSFAGFDEQEVSTEAKSFQCQTRLCLVNHFQGRVSCPYGQNAMGKPIQPGPATQACVTPGLGTPVNPMDPMTQMAVKPQCSGRKANDTVYCSCRCANIDGTQTGGNFCNCPTGFACTQLVSSLSASEDQGLTGAYCIKNNTAFGDSASGATVSACDDCGADGTTKCGNANNTGGS